MVVVATTLVNDARSYKVRSGETAMLVVALSLSVLKQPLSR